MDIPEKQFMLIKYRDPENGMRYYGKGFVIGERGYITGNNFPLGESIEIYEINKNRIEMACKCTDAPKGIENLIEAVGMNNLTIEYRLPILIYSKGL